MVNMIFEKQFLNVPDRFEIIYEKISIIVFVSFWIMCVTISYNFIVLSSFIWAPSKMSFEFHEK